MKKSLTFAGLAVAMALGGCGDGAENRGGLTAEEERQLDNAAAMLEDNVFDVSADSLVANAAELEGTTPLVGNDSDTAVPDVNVSQPVNTPR